MRSERRGQPFWRRTHPAQGFEADRKRGSDQSEKRQGNAEDSDETDQIEMLCMSFSFDQENL